MKTRHLLSAAPLVLTLACLSRLAANPAGETVRSGSATFNRAAQGTLTINQATDHLIVDWNNFSIGTGELTRFVQPGVNSAALNRVNTGNPSLIYGTLQANGSVYVINPSGILVGPHGLVNTHSFVGSTLDVTDGSFLAGAGMKFSGNSTAGVKNQGTIQSLGGDIFLFAHTVENSGSLRAPDGTVGLAAGSEVILQQSGNERMAVLAGNSSAAQTAKGVNNVGAIEATAAELKAAGGNIYALAINNGGMIRANSFVRENGHIVFKASGGNIENSGSLVARNADGSGGSITLDGGHNAEAPATVINSGTLDARGESGQGGDVKVLGDHVGLIGHALVDVSGSLGGGTALIGGDYQGKNPAVQNAQRTYVGGGVNLKADALNQGNGGRVLIWSDDITRFYGNISLRGGAAGGDGGFAEVSGYHNLNYRGHTDATAPRGRNGTLLLDPDFIIIKGGTMDGDDTGTDDMKLEHGGGDGRVLFADSPSSFTVFESEIENTAANILLEAGTSISTMGSFGGNSVALQSGRDLTLRTRNDSTLLTPDGSGGIDLTSGGSNPSLEFVTSGNGTITIAARTATSGTGVGNITLGRLTTANKAISITTGNGSVTFKDNIDAGSANVTISATAGTSQMAGAITASGLKLTGAGTFDLNQAGNDISTLETDVTGAITYKDQNALSTANNGVLSGNNPINLSTVNGNLNATGTGSSTGFQVDAGSSTLSLTAGTSAATDKTLTIDNNSNVRGTGGVTLVGDNIDIQSTVNAGSATATLLPFEAGTLIELGAADSAGKLGLTGNAATDDLHRITAGVVKIGAVNSGNITVKADISAPATWNTLSLQTGGAISQDPGMTITVANLALRAGTTVTLNEANVVGTLAANAAGTIQYTDNDALSVGSVDSLTGVTSTGADITLATGNTLTLAQNVSASAGTVTLNPTAGGVTQTAGAITASSLRLRGVGTYTLDGANHVSVLAGNFNGALSFTDADALQVGTVTDVGITAGINAVTLTADDLDIAQAISSGTARTTLRPATGGRNIDLGTETPGKLSLTDAELDKVTAGVLEIGRSTAGSITVSDAITPLTPSTLVLVNGGAITEFGAGVPTITVANLLVSSAGPVTLNANNDVDNLAASITGDGNAFAFTDTDDLTVSTVDTVIGITRPALANGAVTLTADTLEILQAVNSGTARTILQPKTAPRDIELGPGVMPTRLNLSDAELDRVTAGILQIGNSTSGDLHITEALSPANAATLSLQSSGAIDQGAGFTITVANLAARAGSTITLTEANVVGTLAANAAGTIQYTDNDALSVGNVDSLTGVTSTGADITLATGNTLTLAQNVSASAGTVTLNPAAGGVTQTAGAITASSLRLRGAGTFTLDGFNHVSVLAGNFNGALSFTDADALQVGTVTDVGITAGINLVTLTADDLDIAQAVSSGTARTTLRPATGGRNIDLGTETPGKLSLTDAELDKVTAGVLQIGRSTAGSITVSDAITPLTPSTLVLVNGGAITESGPGTLTVANLLVSSAGPVTLNANNDVDKLAASITGANNAFSFTDVDDLSVNTVDGVSGITRPALANGAVTLTADVLDIAQAINSGTARTKLQPFTSGLSIDLGTETAGSLSLTDAELDRVTAGVLEIDPAGVISVSAAITLDPLKVPTLSLVNNSSIGGAGSISVQNLRITSAGPVILSGDVDNLAANVSGSVSGFSFTDTDDLTVRTVDGVVGLTQTSSTSGGVTLNTGNTLTIGNGAGQDISSVGRNVTLHPTVGGVIENAGSGVISSGLELLGMGTFNLNQPDNSVGTLAANVTGSLTFKNAGSLILGTVNATAQVKSGNNPIGISTVNGALTVNDSGPGFDVDAGTSTVSLTAGSSGNDNALTLNGSVRGTGGATLIADNMAINSAVDAGTATVTLRQFENGTLIDLGGADAAGTLGLTDTELDSVTAGTFQVGNANSGNITISMPASPSLANTLLLQTGGSISGGFSITVNSLGLTAVSGIGSSGTPLKTFVANLEAQNGTGGIFINNTGDLSIGGVTPSLSGVRDVTSGDLELNNAGSIFITIEGISSLDNVTVNANGATANLLAGGNQTAVTSVDGAVSLSAGQDLLLGDAGAGQFGDVNGGGSLVLDAGRDIIVDANSFVGAQGAGTLTATAGRNISLLNNAGLLNPPVFFSEGGTITLTTGAAGAFTANSGGGFVDSTGMGVAVGGDITINAGTGGILNKDQIVAGIGTVKLSSDAAISGSGTFTASKLGATAATGIGASGALLQTFVGNLEAETGTGGIFINNTGDLTIGGVSAGLSGVQVTSPGDIQLVNAGSVSIPISGDFVTAPGNVTINANGATANLLTGGIQTAVASGGTITLSAGQDLLLGDVAGTGQVGDVQAGTSIALSAVRDIIIDAGTFVDAHGAGTVTATAGRDISLLQTVFDAPHINSQGGAINLTASGAFTANGGGSINSSGGPIFLHADTSMLINDTIDAVGGVVTLSADGGAITFGGNISGSGVNLTGVGLTQNAGSVDAGTGNITLDANDGAVNLNGTLTTTSGSIVIQDATTAALGTINALLGTVELGQAGGDDLSGNVTQNGVTTITADTLKVNSGGAITLNNNNSIGTLGTVTRGGAFVLNDVSGGLIVSGPLTAGTTDNGVTLTTAGGALALNGDITGNAVILFGAGVTQAGISTVDAGAGDILIDANDGAINLSGTLTTTSGTGTAVVLRDATTAALGNITAASGTVILGEAGGNNLSSDVTQNAGTVINANILTMDSGGAVTLNNNNTIGTLSTATAAGALSLNDTAGGLNVLGPVSAGGAVSLTTAGGALDVNGTVTGSGVDLTSTDDAVKVNDVVTGGAGVVNVTGGAVVSLNQKITGTGVSVTGVRVQQSASSTVNAGTGDILVDANDGAIDLDGTLTTTSGSGTAIVLRDSTSAALGNLSAVNGTVALGQSGVNNLSGAVSQNPGTVISASILTVNSGGAVTLDHDNLIGTLGTTVRGGAFTLNDTAGGLTVIGPLTGVSVNNAVTISTVGGTLAIKGSIDGNAINLSGVGITQDAFTIISGQTGNIVLDANDGAVNLSGTVQTTSGSATAVVLRDATSVALGSINAVNGTVTLGEAGANNLSGDVTQNTDTVLNLNTLTVNSGGAVTLNNNNLIGTLGAATALGAFALNDTTGGLTVAGPVSAGGAVTLTTLGGALNVDGSVTGIGVSLTGVGVTQTGASTVDAGAGDIALDANDGAINLGGTLTTTSGSGTAVVLQDATTAALGNINTAVGGTVALGLAGMDNLSGDVTQNGGTTVNTGTLKVNSGGAVTLNNNNTIGTLGSASAAGAFSLNDTAGGLIVSGPVTAGGAVSITTAGGAVALNADITGASANITGVGITQPAMKKVDAGAGDITLDANDGTINLNGMLTTTSGSGTAVVVKDSTTATLGNISAVNGTVALGQAGGDNLSGNVIQNLNTTIDAKTLAASVGSTLTLGNPPDAMMPTLSQLKVQSLGNIAHGGEVSLFDSGTPETGTYGPVSGMTPMATFTPDAVGADKRGLVLDGKITGADGVSAATSTITIRSMGDLEISANGQVLAAGAGHDVLLSAEDVDLVTHSNFHNNRGMDAILLDGGTSDFTGGSRYLIFSTSAEKNTPVFSLGTQNLNYNGLGLDFPDSPRTFEDFLVKLQLNPNSLIGNGFIFILQQATLQSDEAAKFFVDVLKVVKVTEADVNTDIGSDPPAEPPTIWTSSYHLIRQAREQAEKKKKKMTQRAGEIQAPPMTLDQANSCNE